MAFSRAHWLQSHGTNPQERSNAETERRTHVAGIFANDVAISRLVGATRLAQNDDWRWNRRSPGPALA